MFDKTTSFKNTTIYIHLVYCKVYLVMINIILNKIQINCNSPLYATVFFHMITYISVTN